MHQTTSKSVQRFATLFVLAATISFINPDGNDQVNAAENDRFFVYVSISGEKRIAIYAMNPKDGSLKPAGNAALEGAPGSLGVGPKQRFLYASVRSTGSATTLQIDSETGGLKKVADTPLVTNAVYIVPDKTGWHLLTAYYGGAKAAVFPIGKNGHVGPDASSIQETGRNPHSILPSPSNKFVFVPNTGADKILQFRFNAETGKLTPNDPPSISTDKGTGPRHFTFHPNGKYVYFVNEKGSSVSAFSLDQEQGTLRAIHTLSTLPKVFAERNSCADIHITPDGRFLYASNRGHDSLAGYRVDPKTGRMTALGQTPTEKTPREFEIDPTGRYVYSAGQGSGRLISYRLNSKNGKLQPLKTYDVGKSPAWVTVLRFPAK
jgi:6-phosphogluconolactonase